LISAVILASFLSGCFTIPIMSKTKSGGLVAVYYRGEGQMLYFVKPLTFRLEETKQHLEIDFTLDQGGIHPEEVVCNFTVYSEKPYKTIESAGLIANGVEIAPDSLKKFFIEKIPKGKLWRSRYSFLIPYVRFGEFIRQEKGTVKTFFTGEKGKEVYLYDHPLSWKKVQKVVEYQFFAAVDNN